MWYKNIAGRFFGLVTKHACDRRTDRQTDRQNYDSQDRASIAASRGKNRVIGSLTLSVGGATLCYKFDQYRVNRRDRDKTALYYANIMQIAH